MDGEAIIAWGCVRVGIGGQNASVWRGGDGVAGDGRRPIQQVARFLNIVSVSGNAVAAQAHAIVDRRRNIVQSAVAWPGRTITLAVLVALPP